MKFADDGGGPGGHGLDRGVPVGSCPRRGQLKAGPAGDTFGIYVGRDGCIAGRLDPDINDERLRAKRCHQTCRRAFASFGIQRAGDDDRRHGPLEAPASTRRNGADLNA
jgi:hypothetical protein